MSGLIKGIGKVFKKIGKFVKKNWKYIAMAVAVYFTAGVALSYFGATAGFAANMPLFGTGGMFTSAASTIGFNGPAIAGAAMEMGAGMVSATGAAMTSSEMLAAFNATAAGMEGVSSAGLAAAWAEGTVATEALASGGYATTVTAANGSTMSATSLGQAVTMSPAPAVGPPAPAIGGVGPAAPAAPVGTPYTVNVAQPAASKMTGTELIAKSMKTTAKLQVASTAIKTAAGLLSDEEKDPIAFGVNRRGDDKYGWGKSESTAFSNMNKRTGAGVPKSSAFAQEAGGSGFLKTPFDAGEQDYDPQAARQFIAENAG